MLADEGRRPQGSQISVAEIQDCPQRVVNGGLEVWGGMKYKGEPQSSWGGVRCGRAHEEGLLGQLKPKRSPEALRNN